MSNDAIRPQPCDSDVRNAMLALVGPTKQRGSRGEACAYSRDQQKISLLQLAFLNSSLHGDRDCPSRRISVAVYIDDHLFHRHSKSIRRRSNDAFVRLMRNEAVDVLPSEFVFLQHALRH